MASIQDVFKKCSPWMRLPICINIHVKKALINVLHNHIHDPQVQGLPSDPKDLYAFLQTNKRKIQTATLINEHEKSILLPTSSQTVDSSTFNIPLIRFLIRAFCGIRNARGDWREPDSTDQTLFAYVYRAVDMRNAICCDDNIERLNAMYFDKKWKQLKEILQGLKYVEEIESFKIETMDLDQAIFQEFLEHLQTYKEECFNGPSQDVYIPRRFYVDGNRNDIVTESDLEILVKENDCVFIHGEAGIGKSSMAKRLRNEWCKGKVFDNHNIIYYDSKRMNKYLRYKSNAAALAFSEMGDHLTKKRVTIEKDDLSIFYCVKTIIDNLIIVIDGIDEFPIGERITGDYVDELERKVLKNEEISGAEMISAIYFGFLFPYSKVVLLGRIGEFESLKKVKGKGKAAIFNRSTISLELLEFDDAEIKDFTCLKICKHPSRQTICTGACQEIYNKIKNIELCKNPTDLNSLIGLHIKHQNENIGNITRTKLLIATIFNRLSNHIKHQNNSKIKTFREISKENGFTKYLSCIRTLGEVSFKNLLENNITVRVEEIQNEINGIVYFEDENGIRIERETLEELDFFYIRDFDYYYVLEPHHTLNEFLCACYLFSHPDKLDSILKLNNDRKLVTISFIAELLADDYFTKDFVNNVLNTGACQEIYNKIKNIELYKNPTNLNSLKELQRKHPNENIGKITRTKLLITTIFNRLANHISLNYTFHDISRQNHFSKYLSCIRTLGEISFKSLLKNNITVPVVEKQDSNGIVYFEDENKISIERKILEELDLFYVRDFYHDYLDDYYILEPHHTLYIEFLSACYLLLHTDGWDSNLHLNKDRQLEVITFIAGLLADDHFTKDFVYNVLNTSNHSLEQFFSWLYNVEDVRYCLPDGGTGYNCWYGLMENQKLSPSFYLLDYLSHEVEIPQNFIPETIICYRGGHPFEWYYMEYFKHNFLTKLSDTLDMKSFLEKFQSFEFMIKSSITIENNDEFHLLDRHSSNKLITFDIKDLYINASLNTSFTSYINANRLHIGWKCDSRTIDMILDAVTPPLANSSPSNIPRIKCKLLDIDDIRRLNRPQTKKLFKLGYIQADSISLDKQLTDEQSSIYKETERIPINMQVDIQISRQRFNRISDLPELDSLHISLERVEDVNDDEWIEFRDHIVPVYSNNFSKYPILDTDKPFGKKENHSRNCEQSMFLNIYEVNFRLVSPLVFADTFSLIPSISCEDCDKYIPPSHWSSLAQKEDSRINEMRIWSPQLKNLNYFLNIKTNLIQFIYSCKDQLKQSLHLIIDSPNIKLDKEIKVFVVKGDHDDQDYYEEVTSFSGKKIEEYKINISLYDSQLDSICVPFDERERYLKYWCCEISLPFHESTGFIGYHDDDESSLDETNGKSNSIFVIDETENQGDGNCGESSLPSQDTSLIDHILENDDNRTEKGDVNRSFLRKCCCCF